MPEPLDRHRLEELKMLMEDGFEMLLEVYLEDSERRMREIADAWEEGDLERLRGGAHSLKGASANVGAAALAALCSRLEELAARDPAVAEHAEVIPAVLEQVRGELCEVRDALTAMRHP